MTYYNRGIAYENLNDLNDALKDYNLATEKKNTAKKNALEQENLKLEKSIFERDFLYFVLN